MIKNITNLHISTYYYIFLILVLFFFIGCTHNISISPSVINYYEMSEEKVAIIVAYFILNEDLKYAEKCWSGGGDRVKYYPYRDTKNSMEKILNNIFDKVYSIQSLNDNKLILSNNISYIFTYKISSWCGSDSSFYWPPNKFGLKIKCEVFDNSLNNIWHTEVDVETNAISIENHSNPGIVGKKAVVEAFFELEKKIRSSKLVR